MNTKDTNNIHLEIEEINNKIKEHRNEIKLLTERKKKFLKQENNNKFCKDKDIYKKKRKKSYNHILKKNNHDIDSSSSFTLLNELNISYNPDNKCTNNKENNISTTIEVIDQFTQIISYKE